jgi:hypothetical protein
MRLTKRLPRLLLLLTELNSMDLPSMSNSLVTNPVPVVLLPALLVNLTLSSVETWASELKSTLLENSSPRSEKLLLSVSLTTERLRDLRVSAMLNSLTPPVPLRLLLSSTDTKLMDVPSDLICLLDVLLAVVAVVAVASVEAEEAVASAVAEAETEVASVEAEEAVASAVVEAETVVVVVASVEAEVEIVVVAVDVEALMLTKTLTLEALLLSREPRCPSECRPYAAV